MTVTCKELDEYPGYLIFSDGRVFDVVKQKMLKAHVLGRYHSCYLKGNNGVYGRVARHRLVALAHIPNDSPGTKVEVNHKDGNTFNDDSNNLEWCTPSENRRHAIETGLTPIPKDVRVTHPNGKSSIYPSIADAARALKCPPRSLGRRLRKGGGIADFNGCVIEVINTASNNGKTKVVWRNLRTGESGIYESIVEASEASGLPIDVVKSRLDKSQYVISPDGLQFARERNFSEWLEISELTLRMYFERVENSPLYTGAENHTRRNDGVGYAVKNLKTGEVTAYPSARAVKRSCGVPGYKLSVISNKDIQLVLESRDGYVLVKRLDNECDWKPVVSPVVSYARDNGMKPVEVTEAATGNKTQYPSKAACCAAHGLTPMQMDGRLKKEGFVNGYKFKFI